MINAGAQAKVQMRMPHIRSPEPTSWLCAQSQVKIGSVLSAVSDPAAPGAMWQLEPRSSIRHVLDQVNAVSLQLLLGFSQHGWPC